VKALYIQFRNELVRSKMSNTKNIVGYLLRVVTRATNNIFMDGKRYGWLLAWRSAKGGQVTPEAHKLRQRRTGYAKGAQVQQRKRRTGPTTAEK
jgi:hypothetical protein